MDKKVITHPVVAIVSIISGLLFWRPRKHGRFLWAWTALLSSALFLTGCTSLTPTAGVLPGPAITASPGLVETAMPTSTPDLLRTRFAGVGQTRAAQPSATTTPTATPTRPVTAVPRPTQTATPVPLIFPALLRATELPPLDASGLANLHNLILFRAQNGIPFTSLPLPTGASGSLAQLPLTRICDQSSPFNGYSPDCLWAISPDGQYAGLLNPQDFDFDLFVPPVGAPKIVENGFTANHAYIQGLRLPEVCAQQADSTSDQRCDQTKFSPDGRYMGFRYGYDSCGRSMQLIDLKTGKTILELDRVHGFEFLNERTVMFGRGSCENSNISFFDLATHQTVHGGENGARVWNPSGTLMIVNYCHFPGMPCGLWGYDTLTRKTFFVRGDQGLPYTDAVIFLPDGKRFIYQYLGIDVDQADGTVSIPVAGQIVLYAPFSGTRIVLAADPAYHYRLCQFDWQQPCPLMWYGDWIQVQRVPITPLKTLYAWYEISSMLPCFAEGQECEAPPESFALNAQTGELRSWVPADLPPANLTPTPTPGPNTLTQPVYSDPDGEFAFYMGIDGKSLWRVAKDGESVQWVSRGEGFFYLP